MAAPEGSHAARAGGRPSAAHLALLLLAYVLAGGLGQGVALIPGVSIMFWPPAGIFLGALLSTPRARWPWLVLAAGAAELTCNALWFHNPLPFALIYFAANALEALVAALVLERFARRPFRLDTLEAIAAFVLLAALIVPSLGATIIATTDALRGKHPFTTAWPLVWLGDGTGLLVSTPLTLAAVQAFHARPHVSPRRTAEACAVLMLLVACTALAARRVLPTAYLSMPALLWSAARFGLPGASAGVALVTLTVAWFTSRAPVELGLPPELLQDWIVRLQVFLGVSAVSALLVGALSAQRQRALRELETVNQELEARVAQRTARLREADQRKDEFLAMLAHELRNPLAPLQNALQLLRLRGAGAPELSGPREMIERQVEHLVRLVDDLLDVARVSRGKITLHREPLDLLSVIGHAVDGARPAIEARGHTLELALPGRPLPVLGDGVRLTQVVSNLLSNAIKYTDPGGRLRVAAEEHHEEAVIRVRDDGRGLDPAGRERLFEVFYQAERNLDRAEGGLGVGLALVKTLVELHGGRVEVRSEGLGRGSEFSVFLPRATQADAARVPAVSTPPAPGRPLRVLVVDDNRDSAESLAELFALDGHRPLLAHDGPTGLSLALAERPEVVILDIGLPHLNGYEVCRALRAAGQTETLIVALTGYGRPEDRRLSQEAGFDAHEVKPIDLDVLRELVRSGRRT